MQDVAYDVHTYKHTTMGFEADIKAMPQAYDYSKTFFQRFYRPENVVLLDVSGSMGYASSGLTKFAYAQMLAASLAYLMKRQRDGIGLTAFDEGIVGMLPALLAILDDADGRADEAGGAAAVAQLVLGGTQRIQKLLSISPQIV